MTKPTPEEKCLHEWVSVSKGDFSYEECVKCGKVVDVCSPSPEARCEHEWGVGYSNSSCTKCGVKWPGSEARVDWKKEAREIVYKQDVYLGGLADLHLEFGEMLEEMVFGIAKALSAAFEKGREAR